MVIYFSLLGGLYGSCDIFLSYTPITAVVNQDYVLPQTSVSLQDGQNITSILVEIIDDNKPEGSKEFIIQLLRTNCRTKLGNQTQINIIIEASDNMFGVIGIYNFTDELRVDNPLNEFSVSIPISRTRGMANEIKVNLANIYLFKVHHENTRKRCDICSKFTIKTPERFQF